MGHFGGACGNCKWHDYVARCSVREDLGDEEGSDEPDEDFDPDDNADPSEGNFHIKDEDDSLNGLDLHGNSPRIGDGRDTPNGLHPHQETNDSEFTWSGFSDERGDDAESTWSGFSDTD